LGDLVGFFGLVKNGIESGNVSKKDEFVPLNVSKKRNWIR
jgi:hypothetical protein